MKSVLVYQPGGPEALTLVETPIPDIGPGQVRIRAAAFGVGHPDVLIRSGVYKWMPPLPANPGNDVAGWIDAVGDGVDGIEVGTKVLLSARDLPRRGGCYAEFVVAPADAIHLLPDHVDLCEAVCLANYQLAWALLRESCGRRPMRSVFVVGAAGGAGSAVTQLASREGLRVIGSVSTEEKGAFARAMGAAELVYYRREDPVRRILELTDGAGVDLILDHVTGPGFTAYLAALAKWGTLVSFNGFTPLPEANLLGEMRKHMERCPAVRSFSFHIYDDDRDGRRELMRDVVDRLARGVIAPPIHSRLPLDQIVEAHRLFESGRAFGKIVMTVG
jgi:NADPH2:quinone reductase